MEVEFVRVRTGDVVVEDLIFLDNIVDDLLGILVDYQAFPLQHGEGIVVSQGVSWDASRSVLRRPA